MGRVESCNIESSGEKGLYPLLFGGGGSLPPPFPPLPPFPPFPPFPPLLPPLGDGLFPLLFGGGGLLPPAFPPPLPPFEEAGFLGVQFID